MSDHADFTEDAAKRTYQAPYTARHPVPNIHEYAAIREERQAQTPGLQEEEDESKLTTLIDAAKTHLRVHGQDTSLSQEQLYSGQNRNIRPLTPKNENLYGSRHGDLKTSEPDRRVGRVGDDDKDDAPAANDEELSLREKGKENKKISQVSETREVTDPITHLPVTIHDSTDRELNAAPENESRPDPSPMVKSDEQVQEEYDQARREHRGMLRLFPPPNFDATREELAAVYQRALLFSLGSILLILLALPLAWLAAFNYRFGGQRDSQISWHQALLNAVMIAVPGLGIGGGIIWAVRQWVGNRVEDVWENQVWKAARREEEDTADSPTPESTQWLNSILASVWAVINPDLFAGLADTLEDVMQASLPKLVRMVSVDDLGQGSEALRFLGIKWLPTGAAAMDLSDDGEIKSNKDGQSRRNTMGENKTGSNNIQASNAKIDKQKSFQDSHPPEGNEKNKVAEGMEGEEGDFVNMEVAFSYRASSHGRSFKVKSKSAHLYLAFYLPGEIKLPVWVELRGFIGIMRLRLQLCPDPPFFSLCTMTFLGQPKASLSCVPLIKRGLNIMDLPIISSFVKNSVDAALAEYVAPRSLTIDLKDMIVGDDFKKDTRSRGVIMVEIKSAKGFKESDASLTSLRRGSSDPYVAVGWAKFGKPIWSTRVIIKEMEPVWEETAFLLVGPEELNARERLQIRLWDSDRGSADDELGTIEVDIRELMNSSRSNSEIWDRHDDFQESQGGDAMPGTLDWSVGYYDKVRIQEEQLLGQDQESDVENIQQLKERVSNDTERKMREDNLGSKSRKTEQQKAQDFKTREENIIISSPPSPEYPTGILSIQIHEITGLEYDNIHPNEVNADDDSDAEDAGDLPSSYCNIILNHQDIFRTRTKPKNMNPFFNAGTERVIRDWRDTEIIISVRDARSRENDPLLGIIYLRLPDLFDKRSQVVDKFPLVGGLGYGRARISLVFRSVQLQLPKELLGWEYGNLEVTGPITSQDVASDLRELRLKLRTTVNRAKMYPSSTKEGVEWREKKERPIRLAVRKRYSTCLVIEFRKNSLGKDSTPAFAIVWLKDIPDQEEMTLTLPIWHGDAGLKRAEANCIQEFGEKMGTLRVSLKFWHGLSEYHHKLAKKSSNVQDVLEVLEVANKAKETSTAMADEERGSSSSSNSSSDSDSSEDDDLLEPIRKRGKKLSAAVTGKDTDADADADGDCEDDGRRGPLDQLQEYKDHSDEIHRQHRGVMQWKGARTATWMKTKVQHVKAHARETLQHHARDPGVETEV